MKTRIALSVLLLSLFAAPSLAASKYPPGPPYRSCPDSLTIFTVENPDTLANPCYPAIGDTVLGVRGIFIGADVRASAFAFYFQTPGGGQYTGVQAFTGATNYVGSVPGSPSGGNLVLGDHVAVYGTIQEFPAANGTTEIEGPDVVQNTNDIVVRRISTGNAVPIDIVTTSQIHWLPAFSQGERFEGGLVRIRGPLKVGRVAVGPGLQSGNYLLTRVTPSSDSVLIDNFTLSPTLGGPAPPLGTIVDSVQGIVNQNTATGVNSYRIQLRDGNDVFLAVPPNLSDAYPIEDNQIRLVFDRNVDETTAETESNYSLASGIDGSTVDDATMPSVPGNVVILTITSVRVDGDFETVSVLGVGSAGCPSCLISPAQQRAFVNGVLSCAAVQAPDPSRLPLFDDRSRFAGAGALPGTKLTFRGTAVHQFGTLFYVVDESGSLRGGVSVFGPTQTLIPGRRYRITGQVQEFQGESEIVSTALITDEGAGTIPSPVVGTVAALSDTTTDMAGSPGDPDGAILTGEDYECMLVKLEDVVMTETRTTGQSFFVAGPSPANPDTILISNLSGALDGYTPPDSAAIIDVTGLLHFTNGTFRICPRGPSDIYVHSEPVFSFDQLSFLNEHGLAANTGLGECHVTYAPEADQRFLNVAVRSAGALSGQPEGAWVVRNLYLPDAAKSPPVENLTSRFRLGECGYPSGTLVSELEFDYRVSSLPMLDIEAPSWLKGAQWRSPVAVDHPVIRTGGCLFPAPSPVVAADSFRIHLPFVGPLDIRRSCWIGCRMPNLDLDDSTRPGDLNGCAPAATANSLLWLDDVHDEFDLGPELRDAYQQLSNLMNRMAGKGVGVKDAVIGKLDFIEAHGLPLKVKYQSANDEGPISSTSRLSHATCHDADDAAYPTDAFIQSEAADDEDIEIFGGLYDADHPDYPRRDGHVVVLTGAGSVNGVPFYYAKDDGKQDQPNGQRQRGSPADNTVGGVIYVPGWDQEVKVQGLPGMRMCQFIIEGVVSESYAQVPPLPGSHSFSDYCDWFARTLRPGGKLKLVFPPGSRCFNTVVYELDRTVRPPRWRKKLVWNFNADQERIYVNDTDSCITVRVHNDDNTRNGTEYVPWEVDIEVLAAAPNESSSPSNPDAFGGFSLGGRDGVSEEFGSPTGPGVSVDGSQGVDLGDIPRQIGAGVGTLTLTHPIPVWNPYWAQLELRLEVAAVTQSGSLSISCPSTSHSSSIPIATPGTYVVDLGTMPLASQFSITLASQSGLDFEMDAVGIASRVPASTSVGRRSLPKVAGLWTVGRNPSSTGFAARFDLPRDADVRLAVFDLAGRQVATLADGRFEAGSYDRSWRGIDAAGRRVPAGVYFCRLSLGERIWTQRWVLVR